jgi:hypothetical protein
MTGHTFCFTQSLRLHCPYTETVEVDAPVPSGPQVSLEAVKNGLGLSGGRRAIWGPG